jgi:hypothetical protein
MPRFHVLDFDESTLHSYRFFTHDTLTAITLHLPLLLGSIHKRRGE